MFKKSLIAASLSLSVGVASAASLVGGSFELPDLGPGNTAFYNDGSTGITGWTVIGNNVQLVDATFLGGSGYDLNASQPDQWVDLTGGNEGLGKGVTQTFAGTVGQSYLLTFDIGRLLSRNNAYVSVNINGNTVTLGNTTPGSGNTMNWVGQSVQFAGLASNTVTFLGASGVSSDSTLIGLDNVAVSPVPEPSEWFMLAAGLGVVGFMARRRSLAV